VARHEDNDDAGTERICPVCGGRDFDKDGGSSGRCRQCRSLERHRRVVLALFARCRTSDDPILWFGSEESVPNFLRKDFPGLELIADRTQKPLRGPAAYSLVVSINQLRKEPSKVLRAIEAMQIYLAYDGEQIISEDLSGLRPAYPPGTEEETDERRFLDLLQGGGWPEASVFDIRGAYGRAARQTFKLGKKKRSGAGTDPVVVPKRGKGRKPADHQGASVSRQRRRRNQSRKQSASKQR
jgi:hypothetical protein